VAVRLNDVGSILSHRYFSPSKHKNYPACRDEETDKPNKRKPEQQILGHGRCGSLLLVQLRKCSTRRIDALPERLQPGLLSRANDLVFEARSAVRPRITVRPHQPRTGNVARLAVTA
jgi:hypothetical protein